ncbi:MAG TPA: hypothetical protein VK518_06695 [Puia sp.]|nr:hypothetical protein [Puia sp.]
MKNTEWHRSYRWPTGNHKRNGLSYPWRLPHRRTLHEVKESFVSGIFFNRRNRNNHAHLRRRKQQRYGPAAGAGTQRGTIVIRLSLLLSGGMKSLRHGATARKYLMIPTGSKDHLQHQQIQYKS